MNGFEIYEHIRNKLQENIKDYETIHFNLKKKSAKTDLGELFNKEHQEQDNNKNKCDDDVDINALLATGKYVGIHIETIYIYIYCLFSLYYNVIDCCGGIHVLYTLLKVLKMNISSIVFNC